MQTCGKFQLGREIAFSNDAALFAATGPDGSSGAVVKVWRTFDDASAAPILTAIAEQREAAASGCSGILPVFESGLDDSGSPFCATPACALSVRRMIEAQNAVSSANLERVIEATLEALIDLAVKRERAHGNLSPGNILLSHADPNARGFRIFLTDLAPSVAGGNYRQDAFTLGRIIYQIVRRTERVPQHLNPPLEMTSEWEYLGRDAAAWLHFTNHLLSADANLGSGLLADCLQALKDMDHAAAGQGGGGGAAKKVGIAVVVAALVGGGGFAGYQKYFRPQKRVVVNLLDRGTFDSLVAARASDPVLSKALQGLAREANGAVSMTAISAAMAQWVSQELSPLKDLVETGAYEELRDQRSKSLQVDDTPNYSPQSLGARVNNARILFDRVNELLKKKQEVESLDLDFERRPEVDVREFVHDWVRKQKRPGYSVEEVYARLDRTATDLRDMQAFLTGDWSSVSERQKLAGDVQRASLTGDRAMVDWMALARKYVPRSEPPPPEKVAVAPVVPAIEPGTPVTPLSPPLASANPLAMNTVPVVPTPPVEAAVPPPPPADPLEPLKDRFRQYFTGLQQQLTLGTFNFDAAKQEQQKFEALANGELKPLQKEPAVTALQAAFRALPPTAPPITFSLPTLEQKGWTKTKSGPDYVVYARPDWSGAVEMPYHRIPNADGSSFAVSAYETPLQYAINSGEWKPGSPPLGPQVWTLVGGKPRPASTWYWPAIAAYTKWMGERPDKAVLSPLYPSDSHTPPSPNSPVTGITAQAASVVAQALGGALPSTAQWNAINKVVHDNKWDLNPHVPGTQFDAAQQSVATAEAKLKASSWRKDFREILSVGPGVWPDTGSFSPASPHPSTNVGKGAGELWFTPVDHPNAQGQIHDFFGNVAEFVDVGGGAFVAAGASALSAVTSSSKLPVTVAYSDVGFRIVAPIQTSGSNDPLVVFRSAVDRAPSM